MLDTNGTATLAKATPRAEGPTYHGERLNQGTITPRPINGEGFAEFRCGGTRVLLSYTVLQYLGGLIDLRGFAGDFAAMADTVKAIHAITGEAAEGGHPTPPGGTA